VLLVNGSVLKAYSWRFDKSSASGLASLPATALLVASAPKFTKRQAASGAAASAQGLSAMVSCALGYRHADDKYALAPKVRLPKSDLLMAV